MENFGSFYYTQLAQSNPSDTSTHSLYTLTANKQIYVNSILICNVTGSATTYSVFWDSDGTTYSTATAIAYQVPLAANTAVLLEYDNPLPLVVVGGSFGIQSGTSSSVNYTLSGFIRNVQ